MKLEEALIQLEEEELFGKVHSIDIEQSEIMKNFGTLANMIQEAIDGLKERDRLIYIFRDTSKNTLNKKQRLKNLCFLVNRRRFERPTHALEGRCSIQLSYRSITSTINIIALFNMFVNQIP